MKWRVQLGTPIFVQSSELLERLYPFGLCNLTWDTQVLNSTIIDGKHSYGPPSPWSGLRYGTGFGSRCIKVENER